MKRRATKVIAVVILIVAISAIGINYRFERLNRGSLALKAGDHQTALKEIGLLASWGDNDAQFILAQMYAYGFGIEKDAAVAFLWLKRADAKRSTGEAYVIAKNFADGAPETKPDQNEAVKWFRIAAENGSREAAKILSDAYTNGSLGLPKDPKQAERWQILAPSR